MFLKVAQWIYLKILGDRQAMRNKILYLRRVPMYNGSYAHGMHYIITLITMVTTQRGTEMSPLLFGIEGWNPLCYSSSQSNLFSRMGIFLP